MALAHLPEWEGLAIDLSGVDSVGLYDERGRGGTGRLGPRAAVTTATSRAADVWMNSVAATPTATATAAAAAEALGAEIVQIEGRGQVQPAATARSIEANASTQPSLTMPLPNASAVEGALGGAQLRPNRRAVRFAD